MAATGGRLYPSCAGSGGDHSPGALIYQIVKTRLWWHGSVGRIIKSNDFPKTRKRLQNKGLIIVVNGLVETCKGNEATSPLQQKKGQESRTNSCLSFSLQLMLYGMNALHSHCCDSHGLPRGGDRDGRSAHQDHIPDCLRPMPSPRHPRCRSHRHTA